MVGWKLWLNDENTFRHDKKLHITMPEDETEEYSLTYREMARLRRNLDQAETDWLVESHTDLFLAEGWRMTDNAKAYEFVTSDGELITIPFNNPDKARAAIQKIKTEQ